MTHRLIYIYLFMKGDVYPVEPSDTFTVNQVLDAHWGVLNDEDVSNLIIDKIYFLGFLSFNGIQVIYHITINELCSNSWKLIGSLIEKSD